MITNPSLAFVTAIACAAHATAKATPNRPHGLRITLTCPLRLPRPIEPDAASPHRTGGSALA
jgi:hypothetical protein